MTRVIVISVGSEIVTGHIHDLNAPFIAAKLSETGFHISSQMIVGDIPDALQSTLKAALTRADVIIITGGLGPTMDDITRETVADLCHAPLRLDENSHAHLKRLTDTTHTIQNTIHVKQAMIPDGGIAIPNTSGTATGFLITLHNTDIICLPGVHSEMKQMFEEWVFPYLLPKSGKRRCVRILKTFGMSESTLDLKLGELIPTDDNLRYSTLVHDGIVSVRIESMGAEEVSSLSLLNETVERMHHALGEIVFSQDDESLEDVVSTIFKARGYTLSVAESCTGGLVSNLLTNIQGSSEFFLDGIVSYSNQSKCRFLKVPGKTIQEFGAVSSEVAEAMANGVRELSQSDFGLAITGVAGPHVIEDGFDKGKPVGLVYIAVATGSGVTCRDLHFFGSRIDIKKRAANAALNMLRLKVSAETNTL